MRVTDITDFSRLGCFLTPDAAPAVSLVRN
jgi:hypothetical protein